MKINNDHLYHGAALTQIAEHEKFTTINAFIHKERKSRSSFKVNDKIGVYLKYATKPLGRFEEYKFTFRQENLLEFIELNKTCGKAFLALICEKDRQICCLSYEELFQLISLRKNRKKEWEDQYVILVILPKNKNFRVYINAPGVKKTLIGKELLIAQNSFPDILFTGENQIIENQHYCDKFAHHIGNDTKLLNTLIDGFTSILVEQKVTLRKIFEVEELFSKVEAKVAEAGYKTELMQDAESGLSEIEIILPDKTYLIFDWNLASSVLFQKAVELNSLLAVQKKVE